MTEHIDREAVRTIVRDELDESADYDADALRRGVRALGSSALGMSMASIAAVGTASAQAGSIGTEDRPLAAVHTDTIDRNEDYVTLLEHVTVDTEALYVDDAGGAASSVDAEARLAYQDPNVEWDPLDGTGWSGGNLQWHDGGWTTAVLRQWDGSQWQLLFGVPEGLSLWEFEGEGDTSTAVDSWGSNDGTINGATYTTSSQVGSHAMDFDGSDTVDVGSADFGSGSYSIVAWVLDRSGTNRHNIAGGETGSDVFFIGTDESGEFYFRNVPVSGDILEATTADIRDGSYHFVGASVDVENDEVRTYVDGNRDYTWSGSLSSPDLSSVSWQLGNRGDSQSGRFHDGLLDHVQVHGRALSDSEMETLYNDTA